MGPFSLIRFCMLRLKSLSAEESGQMALLLWNGFVFHVSGFGCVQNQVLSTYHKTFTVKAYRAQKADHSE